MVIKEQIMLTAFDLFSEHGIKNVSMDDIAHNASISKRTLYELFEDKETLLTECINLSYHYCPVKAGKSVFEIVET